VSHVTCVGYKHGTGIVNKRETDKTVTHVCQVCMLQTPYMDIKQDRDTSKTVTSVRQVWVLQTWYMNTKHDRDISKTLTNMSRMHYTNVVQEH
jgi:hypothetical protein